MEDCRVLPTADGDEALKLVVATRPDVVVLDVMLPGSIDGLAVCRKIKHDPALADTFVIIVTGRSLERDLVDAERAGADAYFVKPVSLLELTGLIHSVLRGRRGAEGSAGASRPPMTRRMPYGSRS